mgnify:CR=1 FL=1
MIKKPQADRFINMMKTGIVLLTLGVFFIGCGEEDAVPTATAAETVTTPSAGSFQEVSSHPFVGAGHSVSGTVKTLKHSVSNDYTYELSNFNSQNGPDLFVYVSKDLQASQFVDLGPLRSTNGNLVYSATAAQLANTDAQYLLIWCKKFSVLFGSARIGP